MPEEGGWFKWAWERREEILKLLERLKRWFRSEDEPRPSRDILMLGAGGVGKTTLARFLCEPAFLPLPTLSNYTPSVAVEKYVLTEEPLVTLIVPPGQTQRRAATWVELFENLKEGRYRGVVIVGAYGHHHFDTRDYRKHSRFAGNKQEFIEEIIQTHLDEELSILGTILGAIDGLTSPTWILTVVTKADLWWRHSASVEAFYRAERYQNAFASLSSQLTRGKLRHEVAMVSLVIQNWRTLEGQLLLPNTEGFDQPLQIDLLKQLVEKLDALREWEKQS